MTTLIAESMVRWNDDRELMDGYIDRWMGDGWMDEFNGRLVDGWMEWFSR